MRLAEINDPNKKLDLQSTLILGNHKNYYSWYKEQIKRINNETNLNLREQYKNELINSLLHLQESNLVYTTVLNKWIDIVQTK